MSIIEVNNVTKEYRLGQLKSLKQSVFHTFDRLRGKKVEKQQPFKALDDVSFKVEKGEVLGIIGSNGAGKSTLLKMLARISKPTRGTIKVQGSVAPLIEVGAGLVGDLTGRENIYLNGTILGLSRAEIKRKFDDIVAFAELEEFIDTPIKRYSSGMAVRLGFAIATSVNADILIVDEVLAVGDLAFQRKCFDRMEEMIRRQGKTVLLVSHNIRQVERLCSRVILISQGKAIADGEPKETCNLFYEQNNARILARANAANRAAYLAESEELQYRSLSIANSAGTQVTHVDCLQPMRVCLTFDVLVPVRNVTFYIGIHTTDFVYLSANNTAEDPIDYPPGRYVVELEIASISLLPGVYSLLAWIGTPEGKVYFHGENLLTFQVVSQDFMISRQSERGLVYLDARWNLQQPRH